MQVQQQLEEGTRLSAHEWPVCLAEKLSHMMNANVWSATKAMQ
jgi:hypothetical protein